MLLKLTAPDMLNTALLDVATGERVYNIVTMLSPPVEPSEEAARHLSDSSTVASGSGLILAPSSSSSTVFLKKSAPAPNPEDLKGEQRHTTITDASGNVVANINWKGRHPNITIGEEEIGALTELFGSSTVPFMPKILAIPTRFDTEYVWTATADSLTLYDYDTETVKGSFHQNVIRIPSAPKASKSKLSSPSRFRLASPSTIFLAITAVKSVSSDGECEPKPSDLGKSTFIPTRLPGVGSCYLEFAPHPLAQDIEIILSFLMMEILRRGRFSLTPYTFEKPRLWQFKEARDLFLRRLRRNTV